MLPVTHGPDETRRQIIAYSLALVPLAVTPYLIGLGGLAYLAASLALGAVFLALAFRVYRVREGREGDQAARQMFGFSIFYLFALFAVILGEQLAQRIVG